MKTEALEAVLNRVWAAVPTDLLDEARQELERLKQARAEGYAQAQEQAATLAETAWTEAKRRKSDADLSTPMGRTMHRISEGQEDVLGPLMDDIRAMQSENTP